MQEEDLTFYPATTNGLVHEHRKCLIKKLSDKHNESVKESIEKIKNKYLKEHPHLISGFKNKTQVMIIYYIDHPQMKNTKNM